MPTPEQQAWVARVLGSAGAGGGAGPGLGGDPPKKPPPVPPRPPVTPPPVTTAPGAPAAKPPVPPRPKVTPVPPPPRVTIGPLQLTRAAALLGAMSVPDKTKVQALLDAAPADERPYLEKAIASGHTAAELERFAAAIAGKDQAWRDENLHVVGQSDGKGIRQQWQASCGPTTAEAMRAELDPVYALQLRTENPKLADAASSDATKLNPKLAEEQRRILTAGGGVATSRDTAGVGMMIAPALTTLGAGTGVKFDFQPANDATIDTRLTEIDSALGGGLPVPLRVSSPGASAGHFILAVAVAAGPPRTYSIHDPWDGKLVKVTDADIKAKRLNIAGWSAVTDVYLPSPALPPPPVPPKSGSTLPPAPPPVSPGTAPTSPGTLPPPPPPLRPGPPGTTPSAPTSPGTLPPPPLPMRPGPPGTTASAPTSPGTLPPPPPPVRPGPPGTTPPAPTSPGTLLPPPVRPGMPGTVPPAPPPSSTAPPPKPPLRSGTPGTVPPAPPPSGTASPPKPPPRSGTPGTVLPAPPPSTTTPPPKPPPKPGPPGPVPSAPPPSGTAPPPSPTRRPLPTPPPRRPPDS